MDAELQHHLKRAREGDREALAYVLTALAPQAKALVRKFVREPHAVDDLTQETLMLVYRHIGSLREDAALYGWLLSLVRSACGRMWRKKLPDSLADGAAERIAEEERSELPSDVKVLVRNCISSLGDKQRVVVEHHYLNGDSVEETATKLDLPVGTVKRRLHEGRQKLRESLSRGMPSHDFME